MEANERKVERLAYFLPCKTCGKEFEVNKGTTTYECWECREKRERETALAKQAFLFNSTVVDIVMESRDWFESITVKTVDERLFKFTAGGYDERFIEVEEVTVD